MNTPDQKADLIEATRAKRLGAVAVAAIALSASLAVLPACNTVEGVGEDVEAAGEGIEDAAD